MNCYFVKVTDSSAIVYCLGIFLENKLLLCDESLPVLIKNRRNLVRRQELRRTQKENEGFGKKKRSKKYAKR